MGAANDRPLVGVMLHADSTTGGVGAFSLVHKGASGDGRSSSQNNRPRSSSVTTSMRPPPRTYGAAVWNDVRRGADCAEINAYRQELHDAAVASGQQQADAEEPRGEEAGPYQRMSEQSAAIGCSLVSGLVSVRP